jgi:hypothetical protein
VTSYISSDVAAVPLLWVVPLSLYLLSFVLAFARRQVLPLPVAQRLWSISVIPVVLALSIGATTPIAVLMLLHLAAFFLAALVCHARIAVDRPATDHLTTLYLCVAVGGARRSCSRRWSSIRCSWWRPGCSAGSRGGAATCSPRSVSARSHWRW